MVLVYSDNKKLVFEMLSKAIEIGKEKKKKITAVIIGKPDETLAKEYISYGADNVFIAETGECQIIVITIRILIIEFPAVAGSTLWTTLYAGVSLLRIGFNIRCAYNFQLVNRRRKILAGLTLMP